MRLDVKALEVLDPSRHSSHLPLNEVIPVRFTPTVPRPRAIQKSKKEKTPSPSRHSLQQRVDKRSDCGRQTAREPGDLGRARTGAGRGHATRHVRLADGGPGRAGPGGQRVSQTNRLRNSRKHY